MFYSSKFNDFKKISCFFGNICCEYSTGFKHGYKLGYFISSILISAT